MNVKRTLISVITAVFIAISLFVFFTAFKIKEVDATFVAVENSSRASSLKQTLDENVGDNLLFLKTEKLKEELEKDPYFKVNSIKKSYPNVLSISLTERREVYYLTFAEKTYVLSEDGVVLKAAGEDFDKNGFIKLEIEGGIEVTNVEIGKTLSVSEQDRLSLAFSLTTKVRLNDCVNSMKLSKSDLGGEIGVFQTDVTYGMITGGAIEILNAENYGIEKATDAMVAFDGESSDYVKSTGRIQAGDRTGGTYYVVWIN